MSRRAWVILADGYLTARGAKTAHGVIRYSPDDIVAVIDRDHAGGDLCDVVPALGRSAPIVASLDEALPYYPSSLLLGVATPGGWLPHEWRRVVVQGIEQGLEVANGLHRLLADDPDLVALAKGHGARLWDVRVPPADIPLFTGRSITIPQKTVLTVGSDCAVGKMTVTLELVEAAGRAGLKPEFVATGQTGILIAGRGIAVDRVISDFVAGAAEKLVVESDEGSDVLFVEGQGSLWHPAYSAVTLGLLHGSAPHVLVLCHQAGRTAIEEPPHTRLPPLREMIEVYERAAATVRPAKVACIAVNTGHLDAKAAAHSLREIEEETGLPTADVVRDGAQSLWGALDHALRDTPP